MNKKEQQAYIAFFDEILEAEQAFDLIKVKMAKCQDYNPQALFYLVSDGTDRITIPRMTYYMTDKMAFNDRQLYEIFEKLDWSRQGFISQEDFIYQITPFQNRGLSNNLKSRIVTAQIQGLFIAYLLEILKRFRIIQVSRKQILYIPPYNAFGHIDYLKSGIIGLGDLHRFFMMNDFMLENRQLRLLLRGLRRNTWLQVNLEVFCESLDPLEFGQYEAYKNYMEQQRERQFLARSRKQQQIMHRSRVENQRVQHQILKAQRRRQAQLERQFQVESRIDKEMLNHEQQKSRLLRRQMLEQDKRLRWGMQAQNRLLYQQRLRNAAQLQKNIQLMAIRDRENELNNSLARSAYLRQRDLQDSRRLRQYQRQKLLKEQMQRERELKNSSGRFNDIILQNKMKQDCLRERQALERAYEIDRIKRLQLSRNAQLRNVEKELQRTRFEMSDRKLRIQAQQRLRLQQLSEVKYKPY